MFSASTASSRKVSEEVSKMSVSKGRPLRWGIISAGKISFDFALSILTLPSEDHELYAVAARSKTSAEDFAKKFGIKKSYGSYEDLVKDPEVDAVYIGSINTQHLSLSLSSLRHKKPVLCEKPITVNTNDLTQVLEAARRNNTFLMEAVWTRCLPVYRDLIHRISEGELGKVQAVTCSFGYAGLNKVERVSNADLGGGVIYDIGIYPLHLTDIAFGGQTASSIHAVSTLTKDCKDESISVTFIYPDNGVAQLMISGGITLSNEAVIIGSKGVARIENPFWCATDMVINGERIRHPFPELRHPSNFVNSAGLRYEADHVRECLLGNRVESDLVSHECSMRIIKYVEIIRGQLKSIC